MKMFISNFTGICKLYPSGKLKIAPTLFFVSTELIKATTIVFDLVVFLYLTQFYDPKLLTINLELVTRVR